MVVHRDVKPDNIGFNADGDLKLLDLGLSKVVSKSEVDNAMFNMTGETGSVRYMAPEVRMDYPTLPRECRSICVGTNLDGRGIW